MLIINILTKEDVMSSESEDFWGEEEFEDTVSAALISCYETKFKKNKGAAPSDRLTDERIAVIRNEGPYIASKSRVIEANINGDNWTFDMVNDRLPVSGMHAFRPGGLVSLSLPKAYFCTHYIRQAPALGRYWHKCKSGTLYEMLTMDAEDDGIHGERRFFTVTGDGDVVSCTQRISNVRGYAPGSPITQIGPDASWLKETGIWAAVALQLLADKRHCWTITAQEKVARAHLGCMTEEIKSLLYARNLPMTSTGRKRPILHLVEAHKRRIRSGIDVDVTAFLRGQQVVEIGGTVFKVNAPEKIRPWVSDNSRKRYYDVEQVA